MAERFTALLELHHRHEDEARRRLGALERDRAAQVERLAALAAQRLAAGTAVAPALREQLGRFWARIGAEMRGVEAAIATTDAAIATARVTLAEIHRQVATFEKLRERDRLAAGRAAERREARRLDEFASRRSAAHPSAVARPEARP
jgi:flagellar export protein FliJ